MKRRGFIKGLLGAAGVWWACKGWAKDSVPEDQPLSTPGHYFYHLGRVIHTPEAGPLPEGWFHGLDYNEAMFPSRSLHLPPKRLLTRFPRTEIFPSPLSDRLFGGHWHPLRGNGIDCKVIDTDNLEFHSISAAIKWLRGW